MSVYWIYRGMSHKSDHASVTQKEVGWVTKVPRYRKTGLFDLIVVVKAVSEVVYTSFPVSSFPSPLIPLLLLYPTPLSLDKSWLFLSP